MSGFFAGIFFKWTAFKHCFKSRNFQGCGRKENLNKRGKRNTKDYPEVSWSSYVWIPEKVFAFWDHFGIISKSCWDHFWFVLGSFWDRFGIMLGAFWHHFGMVSGIMLGSFWNRFQLILGIILEWFWDDFGMVLGSFWHILFFGWGGCSTWFFCLHNLYPMANQKK